MPFFRDPLKLARSEQLEHLQSDVSKDIDWEVILVLLATAAMLTVQYYVVLHGDYALFFQRALAYLPRGAADALNPVLEAPENAELARMGFWALGQILVYVPIPLLLITCVFRRPLSEYGVKFRGLSEYWWVYLGMFLVMLPGIYLASTRASFQRTYPFYHLASGEAFWPRLFIWEILYALQFVSLEFFFRGFVLHGTRRRFGPYAIFVMTVPYCMIHFGKPALETCGAIFAGVALGFMSLKTRSIWLGAAIHIAVAWTMDWLAIIT